MVLVMDKLNIVSFRLGSLRSLEHSTHKLYVASLAF